MLKNEPSGSAVIINLEVSSTVNSPANAEHPNQEIDLVYVMLDLNGKVVATDGKKLSYAQAPGVVASLIHQFTVPLTVAGTYQIRVGARDALGRISTRFDWIEVPPFAPGKLALSSLLLSEHKAGTTQDPLLSIDRRFARSSRLLLQVFVYNAARKSAGDKPDVTMEIDVLRQGVSALNAPQHPLVTESTNDLDRIPYSAEIPLRGLSPGTYSLRIKAVDRTGKTEVTQSTNFMVQ